MASGRPPLRTDLVDHVDADSDTKELVKILFQTISGELTVADACQKLGIGQSRFFEKRTDMIVGAVRAVEPKPLGRPAQKSSPESERIEQLEQELLDLRVHLAAAQIREEIALIMPHLSERHKAAKKKPPNPTRNRASSFQITRPNNPNDESSTPGSSDT